MQDPVKHRASRVGYRIRTSDELSQRFSGYFLSSHLLPIGILTLDESGKEIIPFEMRGWSVLGGVQSGCDGSNGYPVEVLDGRDALPEE